MADAVDMSRDDIEALIEQLETAAEGVGGLAGARLSDRIVGLKSRLISMQYDIPSMTPTDSSELRDLIEQAERDEANAEARANLLNRFVDLVLARL